MNVRRLVLAGCAAAALVVAAPHKASADISFGELTDALEEFGEALMEYLTEVLLTPQENLPVVAVPEPLPTAITGPHVVELPTTTADAVAYMDERLADRTARVEQLDEISGLAATTSTTNAAQLEALAAAAAAPPVSIAAGQQISNQITAAAAGHTATNTQMLAAMSGLEADRALREEHQRAEAWEATKASNPGGLWLGVKQWEPEVIHLGF